MEEEKSTAFDKNIVLNKLIEILGRERVLDDEKTKEEYSKDMTEHQPYPPDFVVFPTTTQEISEIIKLANEEKCPIIPMVAGTNLGGLTIPTEGGIILDMKKMNKIIETNEKEMYTIIEPGVTFGDMKNHLDENYPDLRFAYPLSPPDTSIVCNCLLDGLVNLSNKHSSMSEWINGLEVVLPSGEIMKTGSCAISPYWFSRAPLPDLTGLFINWQGTTGVVTKMAVQLWPNPKLRNRIFILAYDIDSTYYLIKKFARTELFDDIGGLSWPTGKMLLGVSRPKERDPHEPEFMIYLDISGNSQMEIDYKRKIISEGISEVRKKGMEIEEPFDIDLIAQISSEFTKMAELPTRLGFLLDHGGGGLTWVGTYGPIENWEKGIKKGFEILSRNGFPPLCVTRPMKAGHFGVMRFIMIFDKKDDDEIKRVKQALKEICEMALEEGFIPYKIPVWVMRILKDKMDANYFKTMQLIKYVLDPNRIMNPGKLLL